MFGTIVQSRGINGIQFSNASSEIDMVEVAGGAVKGGEGDAMNFPRAHVLEEIDRDYRPVGWSRRRQRIGRPAEFISARQIADVPVLIVVQLQHDAAQAIRLPGKP